MSRWFMLLLLVLIPLSDVGARQRNHLPIIRECYNRVLAAGLPESVAIQVCTKRTDEACFFAKFKQGYSTQLAWAMCNKSFNADCFHALEGQQYSEAELLRICRKRVRLPCFLERRRQGDTVGISILHCTDLNVEY